MQITSIGPFHPRNTSLFREKGPDRPIPAERASCQLVSNYQWIPPKHITSISDLTFANLFTNREKLHLPNICVNLVDVRVLPEPTPSKKLISFRLKKVRRSQTESKPSGHDTLRAEEEFGPLKMHKNNLHLSKGGQQSLQIPEGNQEKRPKWVQSCFKSRKRRDYIKHRPFHSEKEARGRRQNPLLLGTKRRQFMNNFLKTRYQTGHRSFRNPVQQCNPEETTIEQELTEKYRDFTPWERHEEEEDYI